MFSNPEKVTISLHGSKVEAIVDSGAQLSILLSKFVPDHLLHGKDKRFITLEGAFKDRRVSKPVEMPCVSLRSGENSSASGNEIWLTCAVSDRLSSFFCFNSPFRGRDVTCETPRVMPHSTSGWSLRLFHHILVGIVGTLCG